MGKIKGCGNESCEAHKKKVIYDESEEFCSKCGRPLVYVCKDCYTQLPDDAEKYCVRCLAKHKDKKDKVKKILGVGAGVSGTTISVLFRKNISKIGKQVLDAVIKKFVG